MEKADTKVFPCIKYVNESCFHKAIIHTVDNHVVVLGLYYQAFTDCGIFIHLGCESKRWLLELKKAELSRELHVALPPCINRMRLNKFHAWNQERKSPQNL